MNLRLCFSIVLTLLPFAAPAATLSGRVTEIHDGDTLTITDDNNATHKVRIAAIDAPELKQSYGLASKHRLGLMMSGTRATVEWERQEQDGTIVGKVLQGKTDIALLQLREGMAWHVKKEEEQSSLDRRIYAEAEAEARKERVGLWREKKPRAPWDWRKKNR